MTAALSAVRGVRRARVIFRPGPRRVSVQPVVGPRKVSKVRGLTARLDRRRPQAELQVEVQPDLGRSRPPPASLSAPPAACAPAGRQVAPAARGFVRHSAALGPRPDRGGSPVVRAEFYPSPPGVSSRPPGPARDRPPRPRP